MYLKKLSRNGNSACINIDKSILKALEITPDTQLRVSIASDGAIVIRKLPDKPDTKGK